MKQREDNTCTGIENSLPLFVGGDLEAQPAAEVARHLESCTHCRASERAAREARDLLVSALALRERRGPDLWPGVRSALVDQGALTPRVPPVITNTPVVRARRRVLPYLAAAAAAVLVGFWLGRDALLPRGPFGGSGGSPKRNEPIVDVRGDDVRDSAPNFPITTTVTPVADASGLRLVGRDEHRLREGADIYYPDGPWPQSALDADVRFDPAAGANVRGLRPVRGP